MARTSKGHIQQLPSGSFRVKVYAETDPVTGKQRLLRQTCPDEASAHVALGRLLAEADGGRFPATVRCSQLILHRGKVIADFSERDLASGNHLNSARPSLY